jgi:HD superfamily phosphohydrolase
LVLSTWETVLAEIITGDAFGADRMDYLLRDAYHAGVSYGAFDYSRLTNTLRILPKKYEQSDEPALGLEVGGRG